MANRFGRIDLVCPGAGVWEPPTSSFWIAPGSTESKDDPNSAPGVYQTLSINAMGPIRFAQIAIDYWLTNKIAGNLLFVSSLAGYLPSVSTPLYNASKAALNAFTLSLSQMKARFNIRVAVVCPGTVFTPAVLQEYCKGKVRESDMNLTATECAEVMLRIVTEAEYGDGSVVEAIQFGSKAQSDVKVRLVPYMSLLSPLDFSGDFSGKNIIVEEEKLWEKLKINGMQD